MTDQAETQSVETGDSLSLSDLTDMLDGGEEAVETEGEPEESGDEEPEESEEAEGQEDEEEGKQDDPTVKLKVDGKEVDLKQSEVIELAQKGFDYTQKTQAVAEERKAVEAERGQVTQLRAQQERVSGDTLAAANALAQFLQQEVGHPPPITLAQEDAHAYLVQKELYEGRKGKLEGVQQFIQAQQADMQRQRQAWVSLQADETERKLRDTLPGWNDSRMTELHKYSVEHGIGATDTALLSPGFWQMLDKAQAYDALKTKSAEAKKPQPKTPPKLTKPNAVNAPTTADSLKNANAFKAHKAAPSINTLADLL